MTRIAFYGRVSTEDQQDPDASRQWQLNRAHTLVDPRGGEIVAEYFDIGESRSIPWKRRPQASQLLASIADPNRGFEAVVVGEPQRAFYGAPVLGHVPGLRPLRRRTMGPRDRRTHRPHL